MKLVTKKQTFSGLEYYICAAVTADNQILGTARFMSEAGCVDWFRRNPEWFDMETMTPIQTVDADSDSIIVESTDGSKRLLICFTGADGSNTYYNCILEER